MTPGGGRYHMLVELGHGCDTILLILVLFEHLVFKPLGDFRAIRVDVCGPEMCECVFDDEEGGDRECPDEPACRAGNEVLNALALAILGLLAVVRLGAKSVDQACETDLHNSSMSEVDGETVAADPHEQLVREDGL